MSQAKNDRDRNRDNTRITRQIDPGLYRVRARGKDDEPEVGMVFAEGVAGERVIEHWILSQGHVSPNLDQDMVVTPTEESFQGLRGFFDAMRTRSQGWQKVTYIKATCEYHDGIPEL